MTTIISSSGLTIAEFVSGTFDVILDSNSTDSLVATANSVEDYSLQGYYKFSGTQITNGAQNYDFYGFPTGCSDIILDLDGVSLAGATSPLVQFIVNDTPVTSGYAGSGTSYGVSGTATVFDSTGAYIRILSAGLTASGRVRITRLNGNQWQIVHRLTHGNSIAGNMVGNSMITLANEPNGIRLTSTSGNYDAGTARIGWR